VVGHFHVSNEVVSIYLAGVMEVMNCMYVICASQHSTVPSLHVQYLQEFVEQLTEIVALGLILYVSLRPQFRPGRTSPVRKTTKILAVTK
jgi:hypothetical protein